MKWDIFNIEKRRHEEDVDIQQAIKNIEKFAPKKYLKEREMYYYNYGQINRYINPLSSLLIFISNIPEIGGNEAKFIQDIFRKLKDFYDINDTLSIEEAMKDNGLLIKLIDLVKIFYNDNTITVKKVLDYLKELER